MSCNSSGLTSTKPLCKLKPISRTNLSLSVGVEVIKTIPEFFVRKINFFFLVYDIFLIHQLSLSLDYRTTVNWRHIFHTPDIEFCSTTKYKSLFPQLEELIESHKERFIPDVSLDCPLKPSKIYAMNVMEYTEPETDYKPDTIETHRKNGLGIALPNGKYRYTLTFFTKKDPSIFLLQWQLQVSNRLAEDKF